MTYRPTYLFLLAVLILMIAVALNPNRICTAYSLPLGVAGSVLGTWKGESSCTGNRPACKNEVAVYRFEAVPGKSDFVLQFADKLIDGQRIPMGKLEFQYNEKTGELSSDFTRGQTHGLWQFKVSGETMVGTLVLLPSKELVRDVKVRRVKESEVPKAPSRDQYED
jgi:hypothetical protein